MRPTILVLLLFWPGVALAASDPCAKFADADAYNYCLAGSGPVARPRNFARPPDHARAPDPRRGGDRSTAKKASAHRLPAGMAQKPAPRRRVHFQIILR